jgi:hypothetical protein
MHRARTSVYGSPTRAPDTYSTHSRGKSPLAYRYNLGQTAAVPVTSPVVVHTLVVIDPSCVHE